jgi:hypothetical protein
MKAYVFDIDGTIARMGDRLKCIQQEPKDWDSFHARVGEDEPITPMLTLMDNLNDSDANVVLLTARNEKCRDETMLWIDAHTRGWYCDSDLLMRKGHDYRPDTIVKPELLKKAGIEPIVIFEDRNSVVKMWRELGYCCCQPQDGDF